MKEIKLYLCEPYDHSLLPVRANKFRAWWEDDEKTQNHARFCHPLVMANQIGFYILSPATFTVEWNGKSEEDAKVTVIEASDHAVIDNHSARGSFTVQTNFIPVTNSGDFIYIKGIPNVRRPYTIMEAIIEAWWNPAHFGLVALCNQPGKITVQKGEALAHMLILNEAGVDVDLVIAGKDKEVPYRQEFLKKRGQQVNHELDYLRGEYPNGEPAPNHYKSFKGESPNKIQEIRSRL